MCYNQISFSDMDRYYTSQDLSIDVIPARRAVDMLPSWLKETLRDLWKIGYAR